MHTKSPALTALLLAPFALLMWTQCLLSLFLYAVCSVQCFSLQTEVRWSSHYPCISSALLRWNQGSFIYSPDTGHIIAFSVNGQESSAPGKTNHKQHTFKHILRKLHRPKISPLMFSKDHWNTVCSIDLSILFEIMYDNVLCLCLKYNTENL